MHTIDEDLRADPSDVLRDASTVCPGTSCPSVMAAHTSSSPLFSATEYELRSRDNLTAAIVTRGSASVFFQQYNNNYGQLKVSVRRKMQRNLI